MYIANMISLVVNASSKFELKITNGPDPIGVFKQFAVQVITDIERLPLLSKRPGRDDDKKRRDDDKNKKKFDNIKKTK